MENGQTMITLHRRLLAFHMEVGKVRKDGVNPHFRSRYADINSVLSVVMPVLTSNGIIITQLPNSENGQHTLITRMYSAYNKDDFIESITPLIIQKNDMQGYGSAVTYARRYALMCMLDLEAEDDDGNIAVQPQQQQRPQQNYNQQQGQNNYYDQSRGQ